MPELILSAVDILQENRQLLCGFSGFLPQGFSIFLENEDLEQIRIRCPAVEDMSIKELRDHVEELKVKLIFQLGWVKGVGWGQDGFYPLYRIQVVSF